MSKIVSTIAVLVLALAFASVANAQSSSVQGYNDQAGTVQSDVEGGGLSPVSSTDNGGSLPFTGLDLALLAAAGGVLTAAGLGMRRLTRAPGSA